MTATPYIARCSVCGAKPFVDPKGFTLRRFDSSGRPTSETKAELFCESHYPPRARVLRPPVQTPLEALDQFERVIKAEDESAEVERALTELRKALAPWEPKREPKHKLLSLTADHPDQGDLTDEAGRRGEDAP
jgi:hypothetical protein